LKTEPGAVVRDPAHLIDVMPTLAEITQCRIPESWPDRELRPVSGVSLKPIFDGRSLGKRPPIHLLFSMDRGLRDGEWKAVSFRQEAWELYNMAEDRAETNDLAKAEVERLRKMVETWMDMTKDLLHAQPKSYAPATEAKFPHRHPEWTNFDGEKPLPGTANRSRGSARAPGAIRARKNTRLTIADGMLQLQFTGDDPGIAMDLRRRELPNGPYCLTFRLLDGVKHGGEVFYTTDPKTTLPKGERLEFDILADGKWQPITVQLPTDKRIHQLRLDVSPGPGKATIADLKLTDQDGNPIAAWPEKGSIK